MKATVNRPRNTSTATNPGNVEPPEHHGPWVKKGHLDVEHDEQHGDDRKT